MSEGNNTSSGGYPSSGDYQIDMDAILWQSIVSTPDRTIWWSVFALVLQSAIVSSIVTKTFMYFEYFQKSDNPLFLVFIGSGCVVTLCTLGLTCAENHQLIFHAQTEFHTIFRFLFVGDQTILLIGAIFNLAAGSYYSFRAWKMCGSKMYMTPLFFVILVAPFGSALATVIKGYQMPTLVVQNLPLLSGFFDDYVRISKIWGALTLAMDSTLCFILTVLLFRSKDTVFARETRIFHKLFALMYESMLPPVIFLFILECAEQVAGSPTTDWRKFTVTCIPILYFHSVLSALVSRQTIRGLLDSKLSSQGISVLSSGHTGSGSSKNYYKSYPSTDVLTSKRAEEGGIEMKGDYESQSQVSVGGPMVKVEQNLATSEPDSYALNHPHLSPIDDISTVNRDRSNRVAPPVEGLDDISYGLSVNRPWNNPSGRLN
ncbi:uncharacterized protein IL334_001504 [Kwoniella shivajii]|uniref:Uncharacterized protein n=1 Tax=Kwoniella shivajii TaxID=564305 RepID=A0ABZ1CWB0_9TREE|nr:hypothetical protein IL334_001504 [Kwoniella shivajii]